MKYTVKFNFKRIENGNFEYSIEEAVFDFPALEGTEKQIKYADDLRYKAIQNSCNGNKLAQYRALGWKLEDKVIASYAKRGINLATTSAKELIEKLK